MDIVCLGAILPTRPGNVVYVHKELVDRDWLEIMIAALARKVLNSLNRLADDTGGKAFFQGLSGFVTFDSYFDRLRQTLNEQYARAS